MWEPRRLTSLWASTACYRDSFTFTVAVLIAVILYVQSDAEGGDTQRASTDNTVRDVATLLFQVDFAECQASALLVTATFICCETTVTGSNKAGWNAAILFHYASTPPLYQCGHYKRGVQHNHTKHHEIQISWIPWRKVTSALSPTEDVTPYSTMEANTSPPSSGCKSNRSEKYSTRETARQR
jgi:hypothetical protein